MGLYTYCLCMFCKISNNNITNSREGCHCLLFKQMENGISGHYYYSKKLRYWAVVDGEEKGFVEEELPEKRK